MCVTVVTVIFGDRAHLWGRGFFAINEKGCQQSASASLAFYLIGAITDLMYSITAKHSILSMLRNVLRLG